MDFGDECTRCLVFPAAKVYSTRASSPLMMVIESPGKIHLYPFLKQMLQLQAEADLISGISNSNTKLPQWQLPRYFLVGCFSASAILCVGSVNHDCW